VAALPYMPLFVADYLADTAHLTTIQHGAYMMLIMNYWQRGGPLPNDDSRLARIVGLSVRNWQQIKGPVLEFFETGTDSGPQLRQRRIDRELCRVADKSLKSKKAAQASVQRRFGERSTDVEPTEAQAHTEQEKEEEKGGGKPPTSYAFFGQTIKLKPTDLDKWRRTYHTISDIDAELTTLDAWWESQPSDRRKNWFHPTAGMLNRKHQENLAVRDNYDPDRITV
jgi:uncharacterized protein YdaU (DUF1376 family)